MPAPNVERAVEPGDEVSGGGAAAASPSPDYVEYPDGAPPELVREMKESDDTLVDSRPSKRRLDVSIGGGVSNRPMTMRRQGPLVQAPATEPAGEEVASRDVEISSHPPVFPKTPRCPACDSGMVAPGIRHNADCRRRYADFRRTHGLPDRS